jgi:hypothetical protein
MVSLAVMASARWLRSSGSLVTIVAFRATAVTTTRASTTSLMRAWPQACEPGVWPRHHPRSGDRLDQPRGVAALAGADKPEWQGWVRHMLNSYNRSWSLSMSECMPCAPVPNGLGRAGFPFSLSWWRCRSCRWSGPGRTGSVTSSVTGHGLDAPMPARIRLVRAGRWRPSPGRVAEGAPSDHDARGLVPGGLPGGGAGGALPVLGAPPGGVGGVDGDDRDASLSGQGDEPGWKRRGSPTGLLCRSRRQAA